MDEKDLQLLEDILTGDYSHTTYSPMLADIFGRNNVDIFSAYIKPGREFWYFDTETSNFRKIKVTYVRTGVMFFVYEDEPKTEHAMFMGCFDATTLHAAQIYPHEIGRLLSKVYGKYGADFPNVCKTCKWDDINGRIKVEVIWDEEEEKEETA